MCDLNTILQQIGDSEEAVEAGNLIEAHRHLYEARKGIHQCRESDIDTPDLEQAINWANAVARKVRASRTDRILELNSQLKQMIQQTEAADFDEDAANDLLRDMRQLDVQDSYRDEIQQRQKDINQKTFSAGAARQIEAVIEEVEALWREADEIRQQESTPDPTFMMDKYYKKAEKLAGDALSENPDNARLAGLKQKASRRREEEGLAAQVYTSALKEDQYQKALADLNQLAESQATIPRYILSEIEPGRTEERYTGEVSVEEAREEIKKKAQQWASQKGLEYRTEAEQALKRNEPWSARNILERRKNIDAFLTDFEDRQKLDNLQERVEQQMQVVERAQQTAEEARRTLDEADNDAKLRAAWMLYQRAEQIYPGAPGHPETRQTIVARLEDHLKSLTDEAQQLADSHQPDELGLLVSNATQQYGDVDAPAIVGLLDELRTIRDNEQQYQKDLRSAQRTFDEAQRLAERPEGAEQAVALMQDLKNLPESIRSELTDFEVVEAKILGQFQLAQQLDEREKALDSTRPADIQKAIRAVDELADQHPGNRQVADLHEMLLLHQKFVLAQQEKRLGDLQQAQMLLQEVSDARTHPDAVKARTLLKEIENDLQQAEKLRSRLDTLERQIEGNPERIVRELTTMEVKTADLRDRQNALIERAEAAWLREIEARLEQTDRAWHRHLNDDALSADQSRALRLQQVMRDLNTLRDTLNRIDDYDRWQQKLSLFLTVKKALQEQAKGDDASLQQASDHWQDAIRIASADYPDKLPDYQESLQQAKKKRVFAIVQRSMVGLAAGETGQIGEATRARRLLQELAREYPKDAEIALEQARLGLRLAQVRDSADDRESHYQDVIEAVDRVYRAGTTQPDDLAHFRDRAELGQKLSLKMQMVERLLNSRSISEVARAKVIWEDDIRLHAHDDFSTLQSWWQDKIRNLLRIADDTGYQQSSRIDDLRPLAIRYILDPDNYEASSSMQELPEIVARLNRDVQRELQTVTTAERHTGKSGFERLENQKQAFREYIKQLSLVNEIPRAFRELRRINLVPSDRVQQAVEGVADTVNANLNELRDSLADLEDLERYLQNSLMGLPNEAQERDFSSSGEQLGKMLRFEAHPAYQDAARLRQNRIDELNSTQQQLTRLQTALDAGDFEVARQLTSTLSTDMLDKYGFDDDFQLTVNGQTITDWSEAVALIEGRETIYSKFNRYASRLLTMNTLNPADIEREVDELIESGKFGRASDLLKQAVKGENDTGRFRGQLALESLLQELNQPPLPTADDASGRDTRDLAASTLYDILQEQLPAEKERIQELRDRLKRVRRQIEQMEAKLDLIDDRKALWGQLWQTWIDGLQQIATSFQDAGGLQATPGRAQRQNLQRAVDRMRQAHTEARQLFPQHPRLVKGEMSDELYLYRQALRVIS